MPVGPATCLFLPVCAKGLCRRDCYGCRFRLSGEGAFPVEAPFIDVLGPFDTDDEIDARSPFPGDMDESGDGFAGLNGVSLEIAHAFDVLLLLHRQPEVCHALGRSHRSHRGCSGAVASCRVGGESAVGAVARRVGGRVPGSGCGETLAQPHQHGRPGLVPVDLLQIFVARPDLQRADGIGCGVVVHRKGGDVPLGDKVNRGERIVGDGQLDAVPFAVVPDDGVGEGDRDTVLEVELPGPSVVVADGSFGNLRRLHNLGVVRP